MVTVKVDNLKKVLTNTTLKQLSQDRGSKIDSILKDEHFVISDADREAAKDRKMSFAHGSLTSVALKIHELLVNDQSLVTDDVNLDDVYTQQVILLEKFRRVDYIDGIMCRIERYDNKPILELRYRHYTYDPTTNGYTKAAQTEVFYHQILKHMPTKEQIASIVDVFYDTFFIRFLDVEDAKFFSYTYSSNKIGKDELKKTLTKEVSLGKNLSIDMLGFAVNGGKNTKPTHWKYLSR